jgi:sugar transferase (PEP-CTERM system associated)
MAAKTLSKRQFLLFFGDITIVIFSFYIALMLRTGETFSDFLTFQKIALLLSLIVAYMASFYIFDFYNIRYKFRSSKFLASMGGAFGLAYLFAILCFYVFPYKLGRGVFLISWALTGLLVYGLRFVYSTFFKLSEPRRNVLVLGNGATIDTIIAPLKDDPEYRLTAILDKETVKEKLSHETDPNSKVTFAKFVEQNKINDIVVSFEANNSSELERALVSCRMQGIDCYTVESFYERLLEKLPVLMLNDRWFLMSGGFDKLGSRFYKTLKRTFDFVIATMILIISLPVTFIVSLLIPLTSKGPIFFIQERLGAGKKPFKIIKFRTMLHNAEANGPQWAQNDDGRVTKLGRVLRRTRLDELPQLINVFKGEMSLIGPRPEREYFIDQLTAQIPFYSLRFFVKPGITGWAQVNFRYGADEKDAVEKLRYELYYIKNQSLFLDFRILLKTIRVVLIGAGR